jgi:hypothetical protein
MEYTQIKATIVDQIEKLNLHEKQWNELTRSCPDVFPTQTYQWIYSLFSNLNKKNQRWVCCFLYNNEKLSTVFPLMIEKRHNLKLFSIQCFAPPFDQWHTLRTDCLIMRGHEQEYKILLHLLKKKFRAIPLIRIRDIPEFSGSFRASRELRTRITSLVTLTSSEDYIDLSIGRDAYFSALNSKYRRENDRRER